MRLTIRIHQNWLDAMTTVWAAVWAKFLPEDEGADLPDMLEVTQDHLSLELTQRWSGLGGGESSELEVTIMGGEGPAVFGAVYKLLDNMGMVRDLKHIDGQIVRASDGKFSVEIIQEY